MLSEEHFDKALKSISELIKQEVSQHEVVLWLRRDSLSIVDAIMLVRKAYEIPLNEAKKIVITHEAWLQTACESRNLHDVLENVVKEK